jgi:hypothetical protein
VNYRSPISGHFLKKLTALEVVLIILLIIVAVITVLVSTRPHDQADPVYVAEESGEISADDLESGYDEEGNPIIGTLRAAQRKKVNLPAMDGANGKPVLPIPQQSAGIKGKTAFATGASVTNAGKVAQTGKKQTPSAAGKQVPGKPSRMTSSGIVISPEYLAYIEEIEQESWSRETEIKLLGILGRWGVQDPAAALAYALDIERRGTRSSAVNSILNVWAKQSPEDAFAWFVSVAAREPFLVEGQTRTLFNNMALRDINKTMTMVWALPSDSMKRTALGAVAGRMVATGRGNDLMDLYRTVESASDKNIVMDVILQSQGRYEPQQLGQWLLGVPDPKTRSRALDTLIAVWAGDHPRAAAEWVAAQLPVSADRARQIAKVTDSWMREDPVEAADWLLSMFPPSNQTDPAVAALVRAALDKNPGSVGSWAFTVTDQKLRWKLMEEIAVSWLKKDPVQARLYINTTDLPRNTKDQYLR